MFSCDTSSGVPYFMSHFTYHLGSLLTLSAYPQVVELWVHSDDDLMMSKISTVIGSWHFLFWPMTKRTCRQCPWCVSASRQASFVLNKQGTRHSRRDIQVPCISDALNSFISQRTHSGPSSSMEHDVQLFRGRRPSSPQFQCDGFYPDSRQRPSAPDTLNG